ncbi:hypothetical protein THSYN_01755 [Candidatus Thiodictyon syntrophicum]|jgi:predicted nuclease of predicted toxin-antitoxin system|uniref:DUF5615 domain-containing protein n=2 Tax=Candidatus Thiodictyon syntrophicum TaxID=1166950 RepID=A0A2K8U2J8_9GAMM|nr:hypothetical protein THSYN_01755 [Candidatus Thiodictyon syntrophicum]
MLDQGLPRSTPRHLQQLGIQATHVADIGLSRANDSRIIDQARSDGTTIVTLVRARLKRAQAHYAAWLAEQRR